MYEFLTFERFITQDVLIVVYYLGAILMPLLYFGLRNKITVMPLKTLLNYDKKVMIPLLILAELFWRMVFEAMIGYFDMHNYLQQLTQG